MLVTIRGLLGSGAPEIGQDVARLIGGDYVDKKVLEEIAELTEQPLEEVQKQERVSPRVLDRILEAFSGAAEKLNAPRNGYGKVWKEGPPDEKYLEALKMVIESLSVEDNIVIQGRGSQFILKNFPSALHVLITAPLHVRIARVMTSQQLDKDTARKLIKEQDEVRRFFIRKFFKRDIQNPDNYDIVINTNRMDYSEAASIIAFGAKAKKTW